MRRDTATASLAALPFFQGAEPDLLAHFEGRATWHDVADGELLVDFDDETHDVFFILTGTVRIVVRTPAGREVIFGDLTAGQFFGEMAAIDESPRSASATALHRTRLLRMAGPTFMELVTASPFLATRLMRVLSERVRAGNARLTEHAALDSRHRLIAELLRLSRPKGQGAERVVSPPPAQHVLAARIGVRREAVSRHIAAFEREGLIVRDARALTLVDPARLQAEIDAALGE